LPPFSPHSIQREAQLVRSRLEAAGFHPFVMGELSALTMEGYSQAAGGIRVQVAEAEAADVKEFLETPTAPAE
jgi:hypothetical protein